MAGLVRSPGIFASIGGAASPAAPTITDSVNNVDAGAWVTGATDPQDFDSFTGFTWTAGQILSFFGTQASTTVASLAGTTNDTAVELASVTANVASLYVHNITVNGGALDSILRYDLSAAVRACAILAAISTDLVTIVTPTEDSGAAGTTFPRAAALTLPQAGNWLIIAATNVRGTHITNPITAPSGYANIPGSPTNSNNGSNAPAGTTTSTLLVTSRTWTPGDGTSVPQISFGGGADAVTNNQPWASVHLALGAI